ncbi:MAG: hypothetical protein LWW79_02165 [Holophagaceae bacterium]|nr:hypothetical protein [Holophagaceae bacterium]
MKLRTVLVGIWMGAWLSAGTGWAPIPAEVWAMKEDREKGISGAVVLEERVHFRPEFLEYVRRVRILSEAGKDSMEYASFPAEATEIDGRTVYRDGRSVVFNSRKDFQEKPVVSANGEELKRIRLVPPGLSGDCVVELKWKEPVDPDWGPMPRSYGYMHWWRLGGPYMTQLSVLEVPIKLYWAQMIQYQSQEPKIEYRGDSKIYTFQNLPAMTEPPYSSEFARDVPRFTLYAPLSFLSEYNQKPHQEYWKAAVEFFYKPYFENGMRKSSAFGRLLSELSSGLPDEPRAKAIELFYRLNARVKNAHHLTKSEEAGVSRKEKLAEVKNLEEAALRGYASAAGMRLLYYHLLKGVGIQPRIALVADRDRWQFRYSVHNIFQFTDELIGVGTDPASTIWIDPAARFTKPGQVDPDYQGTWALAVDTKDWSVASFQVPADSEASNQARFDFQLSLEDEGDQFSMAARYTGYLAQRERNRYALLDQKEQDRLLKERLEGQLKGLSLREAAVENARIPHEPVLIKVAGSLEQESGRHRVVRPFPGMESPIWIPDAFPEQRKVPIQIPYRRTWEAVSRFRLPKGFKLGEAPSMDLGNVFGQVQWTAAPAPSGAPDEVVVRFRVTVTTHTASSGQYEYFKTFLSWVDRARRQTVTLERAS